MLTYHICLHLYKRRKLLQKILDDLPVVSNNKKLRIVDTIMLMSLFRIIA